MRRFRAISATIQIGCLIFFFSSMGHAQSNDKPDLTSQPTLYVVGYAHLDTEWRWEYPQVIDEYIRKTMEENFKPVSYTHLDVYKRQSDRHPQKRPERICGYIDRPAD